MVTGASAGVGRATVRALARRGARIGLLARGREGLEAAQREVLALGGQALALQTDVSDMDQVEAAACAVEDLFGPIDVWINNAMVTVLSRIRDTTADEFRRVTEVTYLGTVHGTLAALRRMLPRDRGAIVQVGSALAHRGIPFQSAYCAAKHAIQGFCESLQAELLYDGSAVKLTMVQLPALNTPQFEWLRNRLPNRAMPVPPIFQPEVAADAILWSIDHHRREVLVGGPTVKAVWGSKLAPSVALGYLVRHGYEGQQTHEPEDPARLDNLWTPVAGDFGAHGRFDEQARPFSWQWWASKHQSALIAGVGLLGAALGTLALRRGGAAARPTPVEAARAAARSPARSAA